MFKIVSVLVKQHSLLLNSFLFIPSSCRFISRNTSYKWWFIIESCCLRKCIDLEWNCSLYYKGRMKESDLPWVKVNSSDCPIPVFSFFCNILHERKCCIRYFGIQFLLSTFLSMPQLVWLSLLNSFINSKQCSIYLGSI